MKKKIKNTLIQPNPNLLNAVRLRIVDGTLLKDVEEFCTLHDLKASVWSVEGPTIDPDAYEVLIHDVYDGTTELAYDEAQPIPPSKKLALLKLRFAI